MNIKKISNTIILARFIIYVKIDSDYAFVYREGRGFDVLELF